MGRKTNYTIDELRLFLMRQRNALELAEQAIQMLEEKNAEGVEQVDENLTIRHRKFWDEIAGKAITAPRREGA